MKAKQILQNEICQRNLIHCQDYARRRYRTFQNRPTVSNPLVKPLCGSPEQREDETTAESQENIVKSFGMIIRTEPFKFQDGVTEFIHKIHDVSKTGAAHQMGIRNGDELLLFEEKLAPDLSHEEIVNQFSKLQFDGKTRFTLILGRRTRRLCPRQTQNWKWIETSAILESDDHGDLTVDDKKLTETRAITSFHRYKVKGTNKYLAIEDGQVRGRVLTCTESDQNTMFCKITHYSMTKDGEMIFESALCDENQQVFIGIKNGNVIFQKKKTWVYIKMRGNDIAFQKKGLYLTFDETFGILTTSTSKYMFEEIPGHKPQPEENASSPYTYDEPNTCGVNMPQHISSDSTPLQHASECQEKVQVTAEIH